MVRSDSSTGPVFADQVRAAEYLHAMGKELAAIAHRYSLVVVGRCFESHCVMAAGLDSLEQGQADSITDNEPASGLETIHSDGGANPMRV